MTLRVTKRQHVVCQAHNHGKQVVHGELSQRARVACPCKVHSWHNHAVNLHVSALCLSCSVDDAHRRSANILLAVLNELLKQLCSHTAELLAMLARHWWCKPLNAEALCTCSSSHDNWPASAARPW